MPEDLVKISANLPESEFKRLKELAEGQGINMTDLIRRGLRLEDFLQQLRAKGATVLIREKNNETRELLIR